MENLYLAIDIGASSGRHILGYAKNGRIVTEEIYRFENRQLRRNGHDCWDTDNLWSGILGGLKACKEQGKIPKTVGIDTWGVDFVLLDGQDQMIGDPVAYRDSRTNGMDTLVEQKIHPEYLYSRTGIQKASYNTVYQLAALQQEHPEQLEKARWLLMTPDYWNFRLTGVKKNEYTIATTTNLVNAESKQWDLDVISGLGLPKGIFHELHMPGTVVGNLLPEIRDAVGFDTTVVMPASHDTASAFLAIPAVDENAVYISSGTWSLLGVENEKPITTGESYQENFTNEGGAWGRYRYLKNIMGLWIIQSVRRELNGVAYVQGTQTQEKACKQWSFPDLIEAAKAEEGFASIVDVNEDRFLAPQSMIQAIKDACAESGQPVPQTVGQIMQCVYTSLAVYYQQSVQSLERLTGKRFTSINIVGGGAQDAYLNIRTACAAGLPVYAGPVEGTAVGNLIVQMVSGGEMPDLQAARDAVRNSFEIQKFQRPVKMGILGAGNIARSAVRAMMALEEIECFAVASRSLENAKSFAEEFGFQKAYGSYEELAQDPQVELVYIATPHSHHFAHMMLCLRNGKGVLSEKAFTMNVQQAKQVARFAREHKIFAAEAIWTRYMPSRAIIDEVLASGIIGKPNTLTANLSYVIKDKERIIRPELAGGALLDIGVYGINFALMHFGKDIERVESSVRLTDTGVDGMETVIIFYKDGRMAVLTHSIYARSDRKGIIHGDKGYMIVENINNPQSVSVYDLGDNLIARYPVPEQINGYEYQFAECAKAIREGRWESRSMPLSESVYVMELMDNLRQQWGMVYPQERRH